MMFWFKPRKIHVDCFTKVETIAQVNPIRKAHHFVPDWWKKLDNTFPVTNQHGLVVQKGTMKHCIGFIELHKRGLIMPMWSDLVMEVINGNYRYQMALEDYGLNGGMSILWHNAEQHGNHYNDKISLKITSPWKLREKTGVDFLYTPYTWATAKTLPKIQFLNGMLNFKHQASTHIQGFLPIEDQQCRMEIEAGEPLMQLIPLSDKKIEPHIHVVTDAEFEKFKYLEATFKFQRSHITKIKQLNNAN